ncbi:HlyD family efflux transporter periplasmic adaptor subunit [Oleiagrimonas sp. MCCC 1A03011]|uniref:HlyD family secretion protein n=1 Tax=Oleiagrimonas sp. MCCC 1A03011 TaxID=1926883 RepID=UPI000DC30817|nr:HlyD family efflux transporter periplasmic adaptor subunit [Oleiagrimonas sp. MCCC 1A03011]RAP59722.1 anibiotic ABC transporter [Oleiagrimonas sp. MCCC 1A03011]
MKQGLFRKEVVDARRGDWLGSIQLAAPLSRWLVSLLAAGLAVAILLFLVLGHYTRRSRVTGQLVPTEGLLSVDAIGAGRVTRVRVDEGQKVHRGQPLLEISGDTDSAALGDTRASISKQLRDQRIRLQSDLVTQHRSNQQQRDQLRQQIKLLHAQEAEIRSQHALQKKRIDSDQQLLERIRPLSSKGYVSAFRVQQQNTQLLQDQAQAKTLVRQLLDVQQQYAHAQQKLAQLPLDLTTHANAIQRQLAGIDQQLAQNEAQRAIVLRAPRDGVVATLLAQSGQTVSAGESLLSILPRGSRLQAQLLVPSRAVGFIAPGSRVVLRYQAYPYQKFGQQYGNVEQISRSALSPSETFALTGRRANQPLYRINVKLDRQDIDAYGKTQALKPGMALDADILMDRRSLLEWVFEPLYGLGQHLSGSEKHHA